MEGVGVAVSLVVGLVLVALLLRAFVRRDGWADVEESASGAIRLAEKERRGDGIFCGDPAPVREFWRRFAAASAAVERDPAAALEELRILPSLLEEALGGAGVEAVAARGESRREDGR